MPEQTKTLPLSLKILAERTNACICLLHHNAKMTNSYSGSTAIAAVADCMWNFHSDKEKFTGKLIMEGIRGAHQQPLHFTYDMGKQRYFFAGTAGDLAQVKDEAEHYKILKHLQHDYKTRVLRSKFIEEVAAALKLRLISVSLLIIYFWFLVNEKIQCELWMGKTAS